MASGQVMDTSNLTAGDGNAKTSVRTSNWARAWSRQERKRTDLVCCGVFAVYWIGMIVVMAVALATGNPARLIYGTDYLGNTCGSGVTNANDPNRWASPTFAFTEQNPNDITGVLYDESSWGAFYQNRKLAVYPRTNIDSLVQFAVKSATTVDTKYGLPNYYTLCADVCPVPRATTDRLDKAIDDGAGFSSTTTWYQDTNCAIEASYRIQQLCTDADFRNHVNTYAVGTNLNHGWGFRDVSTAQDKTSGEKVDFCLSEFYEVCLSTAESLTWCSNYTAAAAATVANATDSCWRTVTNSKAILNRCVATRNVQIDIECIDPLLNGQPWLVTAYDNDGYTDIEEDDVNATAAATPGLCRTSRTRTTSVYGYDIDTLFQKLQSVGNSAAKLFGDLEDTRAVILVCGIVFSVVMGYMWIWFMRDWAKCVCWTTLISTVVLMVALNLCLYVKAGVIGPNTLQFAKQAIQSKTDLSTDAIPNRFPAYLTPSGTSKTFFKWCGIVMTAFIFIVVALMVRFRVKINVAIQMAKEAAKAIIDMPTLLAFPFLNMIILLLVALYFVFIAAFIASAANVGTVSQDVQMKFQSGLNKVKETASDNDVIQRMGINTNTTSYQAQPAQLDTSQAIRFMMILHTLGMFWTACFIIAGGYFTVNHAVSQWYFNEGKYLQHAKLRNSKRGVDLCSKENWSLQIKAPVWDSFVIGYSRHAGSLAFGSGVVLAVFIAKIFYTVIRKLTAIMEGNNFCCSCWRSVLNPLIVLFDKFIRIINENAYTHIALTGLPYCASARAACSLIFAVDKFQIRGDKTEMKYTDDKGKEKTTHNAAQYAVLALITDILMLLGKVVLVALCGLVSFLWVQFGYSDDAISSKAVPVAVTMAIGYFFAATFMSVYGKAIDCILYCFFFDKAVNRGGPYAMSPELKRLVNKECESYDPMDMRAGDSFFFSPDVSHGGTLTFGMGWETNVNDADIPAHKLAQGGGSAKARDLDLAAAIFNENGELIDYIGFLDASKALDGTTSSGLGSGMWRKTHTGGPLTPGLNPGANPSTLTKTAAATLYGDDLSGKNNRGDASINEAIRIKLAEIPKEVDTIALCAFVYDGGNIQDVKGLVCRCTEDTRVTGNEAANQKTIAEGGDVAVRLPSIVAQFNMNFPKTEITNPAVAGGGVVESNRSVIFAKLRRDRGPNFASDETDCLWELEAQDYLMSDKKFTILGISKISQKCFFVRDHDKAEKQKQLGRLVGGAAKTM